MNVIDQVLKLQQKQIGDDLVYAVDSDGSLCLQKRATTCWERTCEWLARTFTNKMPNLRAKLDALNDVYWSQYSTQSLIVQVQWLTQYTPIVERMRFAVERMKAAGVSGFYKEFQLPIKVRNYSGYAKVHLPRALYWLAEFKNSPSRKLSSDDGILFSQQIWASADSASIDCSCNESSLGFRYNATLENVPEMMWFRYGQLIDPTTKKLMSIRETQEAISRLVDFSRKHAPQGEFAWELALVQDKKMDDDSSFALASDGRLTIERRATRCWEIVYQWLIQTFTNQPAMLQSKLSHICTQFHIELDRAQNREEFEKKYQPTIAQIAALQFAEKQTPQ